MERENRPTTATGVETPRKMQQPDPVHSLENHATELSLPVSEAPTITIQPTQDSGTGTRRPIPVPRMSWSLSNNMSPYIPTQGLDFLRGADQLQIQQTVELNELLLGMESENRYLVKVPHGETLFYATETSTDTMRSCFGPSRSFSMKFFDQTQQLVLEFHRRLACHYPFLCYLQKLEVWQSPGEYLGAVEQRINISTSTFTIYNKNRDIVFHVIGSNSCGCYMSAKEEYFKVLNVDKTTEVGRIVHQWDQMQFNYSLIIEFSRTTDSEGKALLLGAAFLLEYMYFQHVKCCGLHC